MLVSVLTDAHKRSEIFYMYLFVSLHEYHNKKNTQNGVKSKKTYFYVMPCISFRDHVVHKKRGRMNKNGKTYGLIAVGTLSTR